MDEFRNMLISSQQQMVSRLEQMQTQSENRFVKIEAELSSFIPTVDQRFGEVEKRVDEEETSSQASVAEIRKVEPSLYQQISESKGKEAAIDNEIKKIEIYLDEDQIKGKKF